MTAAETRRRVASMWGLIMLGALVAVKSFAVISLDFVSFVRGAGKGLVNPSIRGHHVIRYSAVAAVLLLAFAPTTHAAPTYQQLAAQNTTLKRQLATANKLANLRLTASRTLAARLTTMTTARDNALAGLPAAIQAVPLESFVTLVLDPIRSAAVRAPCDDSYYAGSSGYIAYTFNAGTACTD